MNLIELLTLSVNSGASDLHISAGLSPRIRVDGDLHSLEYPVLEQATVVKLFYTVMNEQIRRDYEKGVEVDFALHIPGLANFRVNVFKQSRGTAGVLRIIPSEVMSLEEIGLPEVLQSITKLSGGLVLVTGATGSGKSTTLAAILDRINTSYPYHLITIEDPIEYVHQSKRCLIHQREVRRDTLSFNDALRSALREDPDVILVGEMRDLETMRLALTAAETGHLVFATLHTTSAAKTVNRILDAFPGNERAMVRSLLSESLRAVICQSLVKKIGGGRMAAFETMFCTSAIRNLIREDKVAQMYSAIQTGSHVGMQTLDQHLYELVKRQVISLTTAREVAVNKDIFCLDSTLI